MQRSVVLAALAFIGACTDDSDPSDPPVFPADYAATYQEVRDCRLSIEHDLAYMRVLVAPDALMPYTQRVAPFPVGAIVLKEQYGLQDTTCAGKIVNFTVMQKLAGGASPATLDWTWQKLDARSHIMNVDIMTCTRCHSSCEQLPDGYDATCAMP